MKAAEKCRVVLREGVSSVVDLNFTVLHRHIKIFQKERNGEHFTELNLVSLYGRGTRLWRANETCSVVMEESAAAYLQSFNQLESLMFSMMPPN